MVYEVFTAGEVGGEGGGSVVLYLRPKIASFKRPFSEPSKDFDKVPDA